MDLKREPTQGHIHAARQKTISRLWETTNSDNKWQKTAVSKKQGEATVNSDVANPKIWEGPNILTSSEQQSLLWDTTSRSTKRQDMLETRRAWPL